ncbi:MAG: porphobilinogen synthase [Vicinamibacterales bacterium]
MTTPSPAWSRLRLRQNAHLRDMLSETNFSVAQLIQPVFIVEGMTGSEVIAGLGDNARHGSSAALESIARDLDAGVRHFLLFAVPSVKRPRGLSFRHMADTVRSIKERFGDALHLWVDICLCSSTSHGHCALIDDSGAIDLGPTLDALAEAAVAAADAGADGISPSDMMDGRTAHLRAALDAAGHGRTPIMSYSTKFASHFYGPFREAADSAPQFGNRRHYQIDVRSRRDAIGSSVRCADEGADLLMVKPAMTSLDLIGPITEITGAPVGAYQVSGEYAGLVALAERGFAELDAVLAETLLVLRRAGAAYVITYGARRARALGLS